MWLPHRFAVELLIHRWEGGLPAVAMAQFSILSLAPRVNLAISGQRQAVLPAGVDGHFLDEHMLDGFQQSGRGHGIRAADTQATAGAITGGIYLQTSY